MQFAVDNITDKGTVTLSGGAAAFEESAWLSGGNHTVTANYLGSGVYASSIGLMTQTVRPRSRPIRGSIPVRTRPTMAMSCIFPPA